MTKSKLVKDFEEACLKCSFEASELKQWKEVKGILTLISKNYVEKEKIKDFISWCKDYFDVTEDETTFKQRVHELLK